MKQLLSPGTNVISDFEPRALVARRHERLTAMPDTSQPQYSYPWNDPDERHAEVDRN